MSLKDSVISVLADYNHLDKELLTDTYEYSTRECMLRAIELMFKYNEFDSERAEVIRKNI